MGDEDRFNRIERKLDGITQILATQAAHDERITALAAREQRSEERLDSLENRVQHNSAINRVASWLAATVFGAGIVYLFSLLGKGSGG